MKSKTHMKNTFFTALAAVALVFTAQPVAAQTLEEAARSAARQNDAKVLSARTVRQGESNVHEIRMLTPKGVVKTVRVREQGKSSRGNQGKGSDRAKGNERDKDKGQDKGQPWNQASRWDGGGQSDSSSQWTQDKNRDRDEQWERNNRSDRDQQGNRAGQWKQDKKWKQSKGRDERKERGG